MVIIIQYIASFSELSSDSRTLSSLLIPSLKLFCCFHQLCENNIERFPCNDVRERMISVHKSSNNNVSSDDVASQNKMSSAQSRFLFSVSCFISSSFLEYVVFFTSQFSTRKFAKHPLSFLSFMLQVLTMFFRCSLLIINSIRKFSHELAWTNVKIELQDKKRANVLTRAQIEFKGSDRRCYQTTSTWDLWVIKNETSKYVWFSWMEWKRAKTRKWKERDGGCAKRKKRNKTHI